MESLSVRKWLGATFLALTFLPLPAFTDSAVAVAGDRRSDNEHYVRQRDRDDDDDDRRRYLRRGRNGRNRRDDDRFCRVTNRRNTPWWRRGDNRWDRNDDDDRKHKRGKRDRRDRDDDDD